MGSPGIGTCQKIMAQCTTASKRKNAPTRGPRPKNDEQLAGSRPRKVPAIPPGCDGERETLASRPESSLVGIGFEFERPSNCVFYWTGQQRVLVQAKHDRDLR